MAGISTGSADSEGDEEEARKRRTSCETCSNNSTTHHDQMHGYGVRLISLDGTRWAFAVDGDKVRSLERTGKNGHSA